jgi:hypothetical protein
MKTPREILLAQHRAAEPKLDAIRRIVVTEELNSQATKEQSPGQSLVSWFLGCSNGFWRGLIFPSRRIWTGLAAIWVLIFIINFSQRDRSQTAMTKAHTPPLEMMSFNEQQKLLNELLADRSFPTDAERPKIFSPKPRTESQEFLIT